MQAGHSFPHEKAIPRTEANLPKLQVTYTHTGDDWELLVQTAWDARQQATLFSVPMSADGDNSREGRAGSPCKAADKGLLFMHVSGYPDSEDREGAEKSFDATYRAILHTLASLDPQHTSTRG